MGSPLSMAVTVSHFMVMPFSFTGGRKGDTARVCGMPVTSEM